MGERDNIMRDETEKFHHPAQIVNAKEEQDAQYDSTSRSCQISGDTRFIIKQLFSRIRGAIKMTKRYGRDNSRSDLELTTIDRKMRGTLLHCGLP